MDTKQIVEKIRGSFPNAIPCNENMLKGEIRYKDSVTSVFYFDYSQRVMDPSFNLNDYQENIIARDYYNYKGDLQWNLYLYFICDMEIIDENIKKRIENDSIFTRKYVVTPSYLFELINNKLGTHKIEYSLKEDISVLWIRKLKEEELDGVYLDKTYKDVIDQSLAGKPIRESDGLVYESKLPKQEKLAFIDKIKLKSFRNYPKDFDFICKKVNLIKGPNGCGKTSLLESIELCLCGKTNRNYKIEESADIILTFRDGKSDAYEKNNNKKYLARDLFWYGNMSSGTSRLYESFNRYNFYDADAAFRLSTSTKLRDIQEAFYSLALGQNANIIDERLIKFLEKFQENSRSYEKEIEGLTALIRSEQRTLDEISKSKDNSLSYFSTFLNDAQNNHWKGFLPKNMEDNLAKLESEFSEVEILIKELQQKIYWVQDLNVQTLKEEGEKYINFLNDYNEYCLKMASGKEQIEAGENRLEDLRAKEAVLKDALPYISEENINLLVGLENKIKEAKLSIDKYHTLKELAKNISPDLIDNKKTKLSDCELSLTESMDSYGNMLKSLNEKIRIIKLTISKSDSIIEEIKAKGIEFMKIHPQANTCPLCNAKYERDELVNRIEIVSKNNQSCEDLEKSLKERFVLEKKLEELERKINNLKFIKQAASVLFEKSSYSSLNFDLIFDQIDKISELQTNVGNNLSMLLATKERFSLFDLNEKNFLEIKESINKIFPDLIFEHKNSKAFIELARDIKNSIDLENKRLQDLNLHEKSQSDIVMKSFFDKLEIVTGDQNTIKKEIEVRKSNIDSALKYFSQLLQLIDFSNTDKLDDLFVNLKRMKSVFLNFKNSFIESKQNSIIILESKRKIEEYKVSLSKKETIKARADKNILAIEGIFRDYNKNRYLEEFLKDNNNLIVNIFKEIHSPREFTGINFDDKNGVEQISLLREKTQEKSPLTQISSGQRSALSVAIFLTLSKTLKNGPPFIILDDPVAHVDDLNVLSFLDYLRDVVIYDDKQIFFATADRKMATFFEKKFSFLNSEFQSIDLPKLIKS